MRPKQSSTIPAAPDRFQARCRTKIDSLALQFGSCEWGFHPDLGTILLFQNTCKGGHGLKTGLDTIRGGGEEGEEKEEAVSHISVLCTERISKITILQGEYRSYRDRNLNPKPPANEELLSSNLSHLLTGVRPDAESQHLRNVSQGQGARLLGYSGVLAQGELTARVSASLLAFIPLRDVTESSRTASSYVTKMATSLNENQTLNKLRNTCRACSLCSCTRTTVFKINTVYAPAHRLPAHHNNRYVPSNTFNFT